MTKRKPIKTTIKDAIEYWKYLVDEEDLSVDWSEADTHCWRCGYQKNLIRCHIIPDSLGGEDAPSNIVLLCKRCHSEGPNVNDKDIMWDWIKAYRVPFYDTFWYIVGSREYQFIYKKTLSDEISDILKAANEDFDYKKVEEILLEIRKSINKEGSIHFGQPYFNAATIAGLYRITLKRFAETYNVKFPIESDNKTTKKPWYMDI